MINPSPSRGIIFFLEVIGVVTLLVVLIVYIRGSQFQANQSQGKLFLAGLPAKSCPTQTSVFFGPINQSGQSGSIKKTSSIFNANIESCRIIDISQFTKMTADNQLIVKLPRALAVKVDRVTLQGASPTVVVPLGDVNDDGVIDEQDANQIRQKISHPVTNQELAKLDFDQDNRLSAIDLAIVKNNFGVGAALPDGFSWPR